MDAGPSQSNQAGGYAGVWRRLHGLLVAQAFGQFNDQAWKQVVTLLAMAAVVDEAAKIEHRRPLAQIALDASAAALLAAGGRAGRPRSKRTVIVAMKVFELALMLAGAAALIVQPAGGLASAGRPRSCSESRPPCSCRRSTGSCPSSCPTKTLGRQRPAGDDLEPGDAGRASSAAA